MRRPLLAVAVALVCWLWTIAAVAAQEAPEPLAELVNVGAPLVPPTPSTSSGPTAPAAAATESRAFSPTQGSSGGQGPSIPNPLGLLGGLDPREWAGDILEAVMRAIGRALLEAIRGFIDWAMGLGDSSLNFVTKTPPEGSYDSATVRTLWDFSRALANAGLALIVMWGGFNVVVKEHTRAPYHGVMELLPRVILAALALNLTLELARLLIDLNNAFASAVGQMGLPGYDEAGTEQEGLALIFVAVAYGIIALLLVFQMLMRLALIDVLIVLAPVMLLLWVLPQTQGWARWWTHLFPITVFQQAVQVLVLRLGTALMVELTPGSVSNALLTLLLGIAVCWLTLKVPSLLNGQARHAGLASVVSLVILSRAGGELASRGGAAAAAGAR